MSRLAKGRTTYLTRDEIAAAALALFDAGPEMSYRKLAAELGVTTTAIYHHFPSRFELVLAVVDLVWEEALAEMAAQLGDLVEFGVNPEELLVVGAVAVRRAFTRHWRVASYVVASAEPTPRLAGGLAMMGTALEQLGFGDEEAATAFYALSNYTLGAVAVTGARRRIEEELAESRSRAGYSAVGLRPDDAPSPSEATTRGIDSVFDTVQDTTAVEAQEELFVAGLRSLIKGLRQP